MSVVEMHPMEGASLYSVLSRLPRILPATLDENRQRQSSYQAKFHSIKDLIQTQSLPFFVKSVGPDTVVDLDTTTLDADSKPTQIKLSNWVPEGLHCDNAAIDISVDHAMRATNASCIEDACCLLELAAAAGALSLAVCYNQYRCDYLQRS